MRLYAVAASALALTGPGLFPLDVAFGLTPLWTGSVVAGTLVLGVASSVATLIARRPAGRAAPWSPGA